MVVKSKTSKAKSSSKAKTSSKAKSTPVKETVVAPVEETPVEASSEPSLNDAFVELMGQVSAMRTQITALSTALRTLSKRADRELKAAQKLGLKRKRKTGNRSPSGFVKPTLISKELAAFLNKPHGTEMARTEVTREINSYIREHSLQDPNNGRIIVADSKLRKLLKLKQSDELTYFNLQRYMSPHFAKASSNTVVASS